LYSWLNGNFDFGEDRTKRLQQILTNLGEWKTLNYYHKRELGFKLEKLGFKDYYIIFKNGVVYDIKTE
jgi:hypothetical protein